MWYLVIRSNSSYYAQRYFTFLRKWGTGKYHSQRKTRSFKASDEGVAERVSGSQEFCSKPFARWYQKALWYPAMFQAWVDQETRGCPKGYCSEDNRLMPKSGTIRFQNPLLYWRKIYKWIQRIIQYGRANISLLQIWSLSQYYRSTWVWFNHFRMVYMENLVRHWRTWINSAYNAHRPRLSSKHPTTISRETLKPGLSLSVKLAYPFWAVSDVEQFDWWLESVFLLFLLSRIDVLNSRHM